MNKLAVIHHHYQDRVGLFRKFGMDIEQEREAILEQARPFREPILDVGTGKGHFALALARQGYHLTSVDISEEEQDYCRQNLTALGFKEQVELKVCDAEALCFDDAVFLTIFSINALHHFASPYPIVDEMIRVVKNTGKMIISDFSPRGFQVVEEVHRSEGRCHSKGHATINDIADYLTGKGWMVRKHRTVFQETIAAYQGKETLS